MAKISEIQSLLDEIDVFGSMASNGVYAKHGFVPGMPLSRYMQVHHDAAVSLYPFGTPAPGGSASGLLKNFSRYMDMHLALVDAAIRMLMDRASFLITENYSAGRDKLQMVLEELRGISASLEMLESLWASDGKRFMCRGNDCEAPATIAVGGVTLSFNKINSGRVVRLAETCAEHIFKQTDASHYLFRACDYARQAVLDERYFWKSRFSRYGLLKLYEDHLSTRIREHNETTGNGDTKPVAELILTGLLFQELTISRLWLLSSRSMNGILTSRDRNRINFEAQQLISLVDDIGRRSGLYSKKFIDGSEPDSPDRKRNARPPSSPEISSSSLRLKSGKSCVTVSTLDGSIETLKRCEDALAVIRKERDSIYRKEA